MVDTVNKETRRQMMSSVRAKNTKVELEIRRRLFAMGFRYRLHRKDLPGTPDMVFPKHRSVVFIHGCFLALSWLPSFLDTGNTQVMVEIKTRRDRKA